MKSKTNPTSKNTSEPQADLIERVKLDLLSLVSHELRTPLSSVMNAVRLLRDENLSGVERRKFLDMAARNAERLNAALSQLLDLSKLVSGRLVCRFHEVSLRHLMLGQLERFRSQAEGLVFKVQVTGSADELPVILGDAPRLNQVVSALFDNALKFSPPRSKIVVKLKNGVKATALPEGLRRGLLRGEHEYVLLEISNPVKEWDAPQEVDLSKVFAQHETILDRAHEGVGGSLALGLEVLRQHGGGLFAEVVKKHFTIWLAIPILDSEKALIKVLESRLFEIKSGIGAISLMILEVDPKAIKTVMPALRAALFRASDTVYSLGQKGGAGQVAVVMDDCKKADAPKIVRRLLQTMGAESGKLLKTKSARVGLSTCPDDATDPEKLLAEARASFVPIAEF